MHRENYRHQAHENLVRSTSSFIVVDANNITTALVTVVGVIGSLGAATVSVLDSLRLLW